MTVLLDQTEPDPQQVISDLRRERDEALAREAAIREVLQVINASPGNLAPVFDAMLERATRLCEPAFGILHTYDGERYYAAALQGVPAIAEEFLRQPAKPRVRGGPFERLINGETLVQVSDLMDTDAYRSGVSIARRLCP